MVTTALAEALENLKRLRGPKELWTKQTRALLDYIKNNIGDSGQRERFLCHGEHRTSVRHQPAILTYNNRLSKICVWMSTPDGTGVTQGQPDCFFTNTQQLLNYELEFNEDSSVVVKG